MCSCFDLFQTNIGKLNYSEERMGDLQAQRRALTQEIRVLREKIDNFYMHRPQTKFSYSNPESNFNKRSVKGVVCKLIKCQDTSTCMALEIAAGGKVNFCVEFYFFFSVQSLFCQS